MVQRLADGTLMALLSTDQDPCDCGEQPRHNNGGNYHAWRQVWYLSPGLRVEVTGDTSDLFDMDTQTGLYQLGCGCLVVVAVPPERNRQAYESEVVRRADGCQGAHPSAAFFDTEGCRLRPLLWTHRYGEITRV